MFRRGLRTVLLFAGFVLAAFLFWSVVSQREASALDVVEAPAPDETPVDAVTPAAPVDTLPASEPLPPPPDPVDSTVPAPAEADATTPAPPADGPTEPVAPVDQTTARPAPPPVTETPRTGVAGHALPSTNAAPPAPAPDSAVAVSARVEDESSRTRRVVATVHRAASASATTLAAAPAPEPISTPPAQPSGNPSMPLTPGAPAAGSGGGDISPSSRSVSSNMLLAAFFIAAGVILTMSWRVVITERLLRLPFVFSAVARPG